MYIRPCWVPPGDGHPTMRLTTARLICMLIMSVYFLVVVCCISLLNMFVLFVYRSIFAGALMDLPHRGNTCNVIAYGNVYRCVCVIRQTTRWMDTLGWLGSRDAAAQPLQMARL